MNRNNKIFIGVIALVVILGIFLYEGKKETSNPEVCIQVVTEARNPATGEIKNFPTPCDVPEGWDVLEGDGLGVYKNGDKTMRRFRNADLGISFDYLLSPDGYELIEEGLMGANEKSLEKFLILFNKNEYTDFKKSDIPRESPKSISIMIFKNLDNKNPSLWVKEYSRLVNYDHNTFLQKVEVGGAKGIRYQSSGLYQNDTIVLSNNYRIYVITGSYDSSTDKIRKDFLDFSDTLVLF